MLTPRSIAKNRIRSLYRKPPVRAAAHLERFRLLDGLRARRLASVASSSACFDDVRGEGAADPFGQLGVALMLWIGDPVQELSVTPGAAAILGLAAACGLDQARILNAGLSVEVETFVDRGQLRMLAQPTITATGKRIPGLKLDNARELALVRALRALQPHRCRQELHDR